MGLLQMSQALHGFVVNQAQVVLYQRCCGAVRDKPRFVMLEKLVLIFSPILSSLLAKEFMITKIFFVQSAVT